MTACLPEAKCREVVRGSFNMILHGCVVVQQCCMHREGSWQTLVSHSSSNISSASTDCRCRQAVLSLYVLMLACT